MTDRPKAPFRMTPVVFHVLLALADEESHAYQSMKDVPERSGGAVEIGPGSLHYTLGKLLETGMIEESDGPEDPEDDARRKYYRLTTHGRAILRAEASVLADIVAFARDRDLISESGTG